MEFHMCKQSSFFAPICAYLFRRRAEVSGILPAEPPYTCPALFASVRGDRCCWSHAAARRWGTWFLCERAVHIEPDSLRRSRLLGLTLRGVLRLKDLSQVHPVPDKTGD